MKVQALRAKDRAHPHDIDEFPFDEVARIATRPLNPWRIEYLSPSIIDVTGRTPEEFYANPALLISAIHVDDFDLVIAAFTAQASTEHVQCRFVHTNGTTRDVEVRSNNMTVDGTPRILEATLRDITVRAAERELLDDLTHHDELTGLLNRRALMTALDVQLASRRPTSLIFLDLDGFKQINDVRGHQAGDELLRICATRLKSIVREGDLVARLGGDEFVVISSTSHADAVARRILHEMNAPMSPTSTRPRSSNAQTTCSAWPTKQCTKRNGAANNRSSPSAEIGLRTSLSQRGTNEISMLVPLLNFRPQTSTRNKRPSADAAWRPIAVPLWWRHRRGRVAGGSVVQRVLVPGQRAGAGPASRAPPRGLRQGTRGDHLACSRVARPGGV